MDLLESSFKFLRQSIWEYHHEEYSFSIIHCITSIELALKERLSRIHENLIFQNLDKEVHHNSKTVGIKGAIVRLRNLGVNINQDAIELIHSVREWRNQVIHHIPQYDNKKAAENLGAVLNFLATFMSNELDINLKGVLETELYSIASNLLDEWESLIEVAMEKASETGRTVLPISCPTCSTMEVVTKINAKEAYCHFCEINLLMGPCEICGELALKDPDTFGRGIYHPDCLNDFAIDYLAEFGT
jgi:hypothetical protein